MRQAVVIVLALTCLVSSAKGQGEFRIGGGGLLSIPIGSFTSKANVGYGIALAGEYCFDYSNLSLLASIGYQTWGTKHDQNLGFSSDRSIFGFPLMLGARYFMTRDRVAPFVQVEAGILVGNGSYNLSGSYEYYGTHYTTSWSSKQKTELLVSPTIGLAFDLDEVVIETAGVCDWLTESEGLAVGANIGVKFKLH